MKRRTRPTSFTGDPSVSNLLHAAKGWKTDPLRFDYLRGKSELRTRRLIQKRIYERAFSPHIGRLKRGTRILDLGCGIGRFLLPLAERGFRMVGVDAEPNHLAALRGKIGRHRLRNAALVHARAERLPIAPATFDAVLAIETLSYVTEPLKSLREIRAILRPRGLLFMSVESLLGGFLADPRLSPQDLAQVISNGAAHHPGDFFTRYFTEPEVLRILRKAGFKVLSLVPCQFVLDGPFEGWAGSGPLSSGTRRIMSLEERLRREPGVRDFARTWAAVASGQE